jgi:hypothetical protein
MPKGPQGQKRPSDPLGARADADNFVGASRPECSLLASGTYCLIIGFVPLILFGGRISDAMGEVGRTIGSNARWELLPRLYVC